MKKLTALFLTCLMLLSVLASCQKANTTSAPQNTEEQGTSTSTPSNEPSPLPSSPDQPTTTPEKKLPAAFSLQGTKHLPKIDNQGSIGCCTAEAVTYAQFTVAVSQYMNHLDPNSKWDPSSGNKDYIFSPKFTYNYSGAGTSYEYDVLVDNGCLPLSLSSFEKSSKESTKYQGASSVSAKKSRSWDVGTSGLMLEALKYRLRTYEEIEFTHTIGGKLTTSEEGKDLLFKVKEAISQGNAVAICGWSSYWKQGTIDPKGLGTYGKRNDRCIWNGYSPVDSTHDGNHAVTLVGYDDEITYTHGGVTMKGAFLLMNSWGNWANDGFIWLMYDACNKESEFEVLQDPLFYNGSVALSMDYNLKMVPGYSNPTNQQIRFVPKGEREIDGKKYPVYALTNGIGKKYLLAEGSGLNTSYEYDENKCLFAVIPAADKKVKDAPADSSLLYSLAAKKYLCLSSKQQNNIHGELTESLSDHELICFMIKDENKKEDGSFVSRISSVFTPAGAYKRTGAIYRFSFVYWDKDIIYGFPMLSVEAQVAMIDRNNLYATLTRTDKNNITETFIPASINLRANRSVLPDLKIPENTKVTFSGEYNAEAPEDGYFTFSFSPLCNFGENFNYEDFQWGIELKGVGMIVKSLRLIDEKGNEISKVVLNENEKPFEKGDKRHFAFSSGKDLKAYLGAGSYQLKNVGTGEILSLSANNMTFEFAKGEPKKEKTTFLLKYNNDSGEYSIWNEKDTYLFDIQGSKVKEGAMVKLNAQKDTRDTQSWIFTQNEKGQLLITMKNYPTYAFGYNQKFCISEKHDSDNFLWELEATEVADTFLHVVKAEGGATLQCAVPAEYANLKVVVSKDGKTVKETEQAPKDGKLSVNFALEKGTYLFTLLYENECVGKEIIYEVK